MFIFSAIIFTEYPGILHWFNLFTRNHNRWSQTTFVPKLLKLKSVSCCFDICHIRTLSRCKNDCYFNERVFKLVLQTSILNTSFRI